MSTETVEVTVKNVPGNGKSKTSDLKYQLNKQSTVSLIRNYLSYEEATRNYTSYDLIENHRVLGDEDLLEELAGNGLSLTLHFKPKAYTFTSAVEHVFGLREALGFSSELEDNISEYAISSGSQFQDMNLELSKKATDEISGEEKAKFVKICNEILEDSNAEFDLAHIKTGKSLISPVLRSLHFSPYNPVPAYFRSKGHLLYLQVVTLENETFHVTCSISGFYINKSSSIKFDPYPKTEFDQKFNLIDLLSEVSKKFNQHVNALKSKLSSADNAQYVKPATCFLSKPWLVSQIPTNNSDFMRTQLEYYRKDEERNYCDEFQAVKDLEINTAFDRLKNEKITAGLLHEFNTEAVKGAMAILNNELTPIDPSTSGEKAVYFHKSLIFSFVADVNGTYAESGGDEAAYAAANQDMQIINYLNRLGLKNVRHCLTAVVEYAGQRLLVQSPVPGLLTPVGVNIIVDENGAEVADPKETLISVNYGYDELTSTLKYDETFHETVDEFSKSFYLKNHKVEEVDLKISSRSKGLFGVDQRAYVLDLANTNPLDIEFAKNYYDSITEERYPHRQTLIRRELIEKWRAEKVEASGKSLDEASDDSKFSYNPDAYILEGVEDENVAEMSTYLNETVLPLFLDDILKGNTNLPYDGEHLTSMFHNNGINMRYLGKAIELIKLRYSEDNQKRSAYLAKIQKENEEYESWESEYVNKVQKLVKDREDKINEYIKAKKEIPEELTKKIQLNDEDLKKPVKNEGYTVDVDQYDGMISVCELEIIARSMKHILRQQSKELSSHTLVVHLVAFFFNLLFGNDYNEKAFVEPVDSMFVSEDLKFSRFTREELIQEVRLQAKLRFRYELPNDWLASVEKKFSKFALIRAICQKFGVQLINKEYFFTKQQYQEWKQAQDKKVRNKLVDPEQTFSVNDISLKPIVKGSLYESLISEELWMQGVSLMNQVSQEQEEAESKKVDSEKDETADNSATEKPVEQTEEEIAAQEDRTKRANEALNLLRQSIAFKEDVFGLVHPSLVSSYLLLSNVYSKLEQYEIAITMCNKASLLSERCYGVDSFETVRILSNLAYLEFAQGSFTNCSVIIKKLQQLLQLLEPEAHSGRVNIFNLLFQLTSKVSETKLEIKVLNKLSELLLEITSNEETLPYGQNESRIANLYISSDDMKHALDHVVKAREIFGKELGLNDETTLTAKRWYETIKEIIAKQQEDKKVKSSQQQKINGSSDKNTKKTSKNNAPNLANKSVEELLQFIEGSASNKKSPKSSKKKNGKK